MKKIKLKDKGTNKFNISWCATSSKEDKEGLKKTIDSIKSQTIKPYEIIVTYGGNISQGRNDYLKKAKGKYLATFDGGCIYPKDWSEKLISKMIEDKSDISVGIVKPLTSKNKIQRFCGSRMPDYENFSEEDWTEFIPSNRQVIFKKDIIKKLGLLPEKLWRSDDTYWFQKARKIGLKFSYCSEATVYWEMKTSLRSYLKTVYNDTKCDFQFGIPSYGAPKRNKSKVGIYNSVVAILAGFVKIGGIISGKLHSKNKIKI
jgi:glycosyltransferase involved in cell wall biosynthesis